MISELFPPEVVVREASVDADEASLLPGEAAVVAGAIAKRRRQFTAGRLAAREALAELGVHGFALLPDEQRVPVWPEGIVGSISHTGGRCAAAVARRSDFVGIGLDIESADPLEDRLIARICTGRERKDLEALAPELRGQRAKLHFSAKESFYKSYFPPLREFLEFEDVEVEIETATGSFVARLVNAAKPSLEGARELRGRFAIEADHVLCAMVAPVLR